MHNYWVIFFYAGVIAAISIYFYKGKFNNIFFSEKTIPWYMSGFSYFLIYPDTVNMISKMGIATQTGYSGMWIFYSGVLSAGILPIIFAPLWSRLRFITDNQFIIKRFSGSGARLLHLFRAGYVGYLVVALIAAQIYIGLAKLFTIYFNMSYLAVFGILVVLTLLIIAKNSLQLKIKIDFINGILYFVAFGIGAFYVLHYFGGASAMYTTLTAHYSTSVQLFPDRLSDSNLETLPNILTFFVIQWWSINVLDGGGPEAQRLMNLKSRFDAFKVAFAPLILFAIIFLFHSVVLDAGILFSKQFPDQIPWINGQQDYEAVFIGLYKLALPPVAGQFVFLAFFIGLVSILEAFINWGASFMAVDIIKTYTHKHISDIANSKLSYLIMVIIALTGLLFAYFNTHLLSFQKFVFALGAGVGPVFILRWFWWRINVWSQLTAMLTSLVYALLFDGANHYFPEFQTLIDHYLIVFNISYYPFKLIILTVMVTVSWVTVTFLTRPDSSEHLQRFTQLVSPGGFWPKSFEQGKVLTAKKWLLLGLFPVISLLPFLFIWHLKFGSIVLGGFMVLTWIILIVFVTRQMHTFLKNE